MSRRHINDQNLAEHVNEILEENGDEEMDEDGGNASDRPMSDDEMDHSDEELEDLFGYDSDADPEYIPSDDDEVDDRESLGDDDEVGQPNVQGNQGHNVPNYLLGLTWGPVDDNKLFSFQMNRVPVLTDETIEKIQGASPFEVFQLFVDDDLFLEIATQTNLYAEQCIAAGEPSDHSRLTSWVPTNTEEIKRFFGIIYNLDGPSSSAQYQQILKQKQAL